MKRPSAAVVASCLLAATLILGQSALRAADLGGATVGMPARIENLVLPGSELEAKPLDDPKKPVVLRIIKTYTHGTAFRYDLVYYGLEAGDFDLREYLRRKDGSTTTGLPALRVKIQSVLDPGQILPRPLEARPSPSLGGYRLAIIGLGAFWGLGLLGILFFRRRLQAALIERARPLTLADRLRPLVEQALSGKLSRGEHADLERLLLAFWRKQLRLEESRPAEAFAVLRGHPEAGPLLKQLEFWLHRPASFEPVDLGPLLRPYQNMPAESFDGRSA